MDKRVEESVMVPVNVQFAIRTEADSPLRRWPLVEIWNARFVRDTKSRSFSKTRNEETGSEEEERESDGSVEESGTPERRTEERELNV